MSCLLAVVLHWLLCQLKLKHHGAWQADAVKQQQAAAQKLSKQHPVVADAFARLASREAEGRAMLSAVHGKAGARAGRKRGRDTGSIALDKPARKRQPPPRYSACCPTSPPPSAIGKSQQCQDAFELSDSWS